MSQRRLPAEIYWRRRLLLVALVIAIVWGVLQLTGGGDDEPATAAGTPTARASATTPVPTTPAVPEQTVDGLVDVSVVSAATACDPEKVRITPTVRPGQLTKGPVDIGLVVSSTQTTACTLEPDDAEAIAVISANGTPVWDSTVCKTSLLNTPVQVSPQWATLATVQWTGRGSGSNCADNQGWATAGTYTVQIGTLGGEPGETKFSLDARPGRVKSSPAPATPAAPTDPAAPAAPAAPATPEATVPAPAASGTPENPSDEPPVTPAD